MKPIKIGILGLGTVATGVAAIFQKNINEIKRRTNQSIVIESVYVRSLNRSNPYNLNLTTNITDILFNDDIDIVVELMGGITPAFDYISTAIEQKKHIITANKELIAIHGNELLNKAQEHNVALRFEAAVAGGIPILKSIREGMSANKIDSIAGIINGTSNYILTEMRDHGNSFEAALKEAQKLGYAEADPTFDIKGIDAGHKLTILASMAFGIPLNFENLYIKGIDGLTLESIQYADLLGYTIKHVGLAKKQGDGIELRVHPTLIPHTHIMSNVHGVMNAVIMNGNAVGSIFNYGAGAGGEATASAVIADIIDLIYAKSINNLSPSLGFQLNQISPCEIIKQENFTSSYFIIIKAHVKYSENEITKLLNQHEVILEKQQYDEKNYCLIGITEKTVEKNIENLLNDVMLLDGINYTSYIHVEKFA